MTSQLPEWRKAWKLDDPVWVRQRKAEWKRIKEKLPVVAWFVRKSEHVKLKNYFLTGSGYIPEPPEEDWEFLRYDPNRPLDVQAAILFECWLNPDNSAENWNEIVKRHLSRVVRRHGESSIDRSTYGNSRARFRELIRNDFPTEGSLFSGLEERIYRLLGPTRCRPEDFPEKDRAAYWRECSTVFATFWRPLNEYLEAATINPANIAAALVREWCDSVPGTCEYKLMEAEEDERRDILEATVKGLGGMVRHAREIIQAPEKHDPRQVSVAQQILECLAEVQLPVPFETEVAPYLRAKV